MPLRAARAALMLLCASCGSSTTVADAAIDATPASGDAGLADAPGETQFAGETAVKVLAARDGWLVLLETLQTQLLVTVPARVITLVGGSLDSARTFDPQAGWTLIDAVAHPSGEVSAVYLRVDSMDPFPLRIQLSRYRTDGSRIDTEVPPVAPADPSDLQARFVASYDRARLIAAGEDLDLAARWSGNAVYAYRYTFGADGFRQAWATPVEPEAGILIVGIIGGGFDNFHQGDNKLFVYLDADAAGNVYVAVPSTQEVLAAHDAAFGEDLSAGADPDHFDFGTAVLTKLDPAGRRVYSKLLGIPGRFKSLLNLRAGEDSVYLVGRVKTGGEPDSWDAWILSAQAETGALGFEAAVDVQHGDMFWDLAAIPDGRTIAVGSTNYTQNPNGLSVSDQRDALAVRLDPQGRVIERLALPHGAPDRGNEAMTVRVGPGGVLAIGGMLDGPGTHAEVRSNGFLELQPLPPPTR